MAESQLHRWAEIVFLSLSKTVPELAWRQPDLRLFAGRVSTVTGWLVWAWLVSGGLDPPKSEAQGYSSQCLLLSPTWWYEYWLVLQVSQLMKKKTQVRGTGAFWACTSFLVCSALTCLPARSLVLVSHRNTTLHQGIISCPKKVILHLDLGWNKRSRIYCRLQPQGCLSLTVLASFNYHVANMVKTFLRHWRLCSIGACLRERRSSP